MKPTAYRELRRQAPRLALALLFQSEQQKQLLATLFLFGLELDRVAAQASEPMLALIRLKWWEDQLDSGTEEAGPLSGYLHHAMTEGQLSREDITGLIRGKTQTVQAGQTDRSENWADLVNLMAVKTGEQSSDLPRLIGRAVAQSRAGQPVGQVPSAQDIYRTCGAGCEFLICLAYLATEADKRDLDTAPFLIFGLLKQVVLKPASR